MKENELRQHTDCAICKRKIGHTGLPLFWRVTIEPFGIDLSAVRRQDGLTAMLGGSVAIAAAMGPDEDMAKPLAAPVTITVCQHCACDNALPVAVMAERKTA